MLYFHCFKDEKNTITPGLQTILRIILFIIYIKCLWFYRCTPSISADFFLSMIWMSHEPSGIWVMKEYPGRKKTNVFIASWLQGDFLCSMRQLGIFTKAGRSTAKVTSYPTTAAPISLTHSTLIQCVGREEDAITSNRLQRGIPH